MDGIGVLYIVLWDKLIPRWELINMENIFRIFSMLNTSFICLTSIPILGKLKVELAKGPSHMGCRKFSIFQNIFMLINWSYESQYMAQTLQKGLSTNLKFSEPFDVLMQLINLAHFHSYFINMDSLPTKYKYKWTKHLLSYFHYKNIHKISIKTCII